MIPRGAHAPLPVHYGPEGTFRLCRQLLRDMKDLVVLPARIGDFCSFALRAFQIPRVPDLPAAFRIKRGLIKDQLKAGTFLFGHHLPVLPELNGGFQLIVTGEFRALSRRQDHPVLCRCFRSGPGAVLLGFHSAVKTLPVQLVPPFPKDERGEVNRKPEGVVKLKCPASVDGFPFGFPNHGIQASQSLFQGFQEG